VILVFQSDLVDAVLRMILGWGDARTKGPLFWQEYTPVKRGICEPISLKFSDRISAKATVPRTLFDQYLNKAVSSGTASIYFQ